MFRAVLERHRGRARLGVDVGERQLFPEVDDGGAKLRAHMETRGHKLEIVESSRTSCTVRTTVGPLGFRPAALTVTADEVERDGWHKHPVWRAEPQRFLEGFATRAAARKVLAGEPFAAPGERSWRSSQRPRGLRPRRLQPVRFVFGALQRRSESGAIRGAGFEGAPSYEVAELQPPAVRILSTDT